MLAGQQVFLASRAVNCVDKNVGRGKLRGKMTDVAVVEVVIKSSKKLESEERGRHKKRAGGDLDVVSVLIDTVYVHKLIVEANSQAIFT